MSKVLIVYATSEGQTANIAHEIAGALRARGHDLLVRRVADLPAAEPLERYDAIAVGSSIHAGNHDPSVVNWVKAHRDALEAGHGAFFSVSLSAASDQPEEQEGLRQCLDRFFEETAWKPELVACFAGALRFSRYGLIKRMLMRDIAKKHGENPKPGHDYEYTDWDSVQRFAEDILHRIPTSTPSD